MNLEGLQAILDKEEVVSTPLAADLLNQPGRVEEVFRRHVRTYIPLGRTATGGEQGLSVAEFERQIVRDVRSGGAICGYLTGEYGYGKTSTALYLWERAHAGNVLAVPPFKFQKLKDLVVAIYGWVKYELDRTRPSLLQKAHEIYNVAVDRSAHAFATRYRMSLDDAQRMIQEQPDLLRLTTYDYIRFIESLTSLTQEAGFDGLLVLADELQQYIEPAVQAGQRDPISALFDLIEAIRSRRRQLPFGLILIIPPKDLSLLRDQRGDLVHRLLQTSLDLNAIYDRGFPQRLWYRLATTFAFEDHRDRIMSAECLNALGQIAARDDLSDGPRTVINAFRRAIKRYIAAGYPEDAPYTPEDLIDDFLSGAITFDSARRISHITSLALEHSMIRGHPQRERVIKWAAAFPQEGLIRELQERLGLVKTIEDLAHSVLNDVIVEVGDRRNGGITLRGLDHAGVQTDWLTNAIREFWRSFDHDHELSHQHIMKAFLKMVTSRVFPENQWSASRASSGGLFASAGVILEGCFSSLQRHFPDRRIAVQALWQDEPDAGTCTDAEITVLFRLYSEGEDVQSCSGIQIDVPARRIVVALDLSRRDDTLVSQQIDQFVRPAILSTRLTPRLLLALYQFLEEKRVNNLIPKEDQQFVQYAFQGALLDAAFHLLFHPDLDESRGVGRERLLESVLAELLKQIYPTYKTLIRTSQWNSALQKYRNALQRHDMSYERQGKLPIEGTKREIAAIFGLSDTGFDNFVENFGDLIVIERPFPSRATARTGGKGAVRLTLHPLEQEIMGWIRAADQNPSSEHPRPSLPLAEIRRRAGELGYLLPEIEAVVALLEDRQFVELQHDWLSEKAIATPSLDEIERALTDWNNDLALFKQAFPSSAQLTQWQQEAETLRCEIEEHLRHRLDDRRMLEINGQIRRFQRSLDAFVEEQRQQLHGRARERHHSLPQFDRSLIARLDTTVRGELPFTQSLDDLRRAALHRYEEIDDAIKRIRGKLDEIQRATATEDRLLTDVVGSAAELARCEQDINAVRRQHDTFLECAKTLEGWLDLAEQASCLHHHLGQLSHEFGVYQTAFGQWVHDVQAVLMNITPETIKLSAPYHRQLNKLQDAVHQAVATATQQFKDREERYRRIIGVELGLNESMLWTPCQYNPQSVTESEICLLEHVKATIRRWCQQTGYIIKQTHIDIRSTLESPQVAALTSHDRQRLQEQGVQLERKLRALMQHLADQEGQTEDPTILLDFPLEGEGQFHQLAQNLGHIRKHVEQAQQEAGSLHRALQALQMTLAEERLFAAISASHTQVEVASLRSMTDELTDADFWQALQGLHAKRRLRIYCERMVDE